MDILYLLGDTFVGILLPLFIFSMGLFFTWYTRGFFLLHPVKTCKLLFIKEEKSKISPFRALSVSLAGTLGVGNITGVAVALLLGGAGSVFWMWVSAFFAMILKYAEIVLSFGYRKTEGGERVGGPMYYMKEGIGGKCGRVFAFLFCFFTVISAFFMGNGVQIRAATDAMYETFGMPKLPFAVLIALLCFFFLWKGYDKISRVTAVLIPILSAFYMLLCIRIVILGFSEIPAVMHLIFRDAFSFSAAGGGFIGFLSGSALRHGVAKGCFSHEAGCGTAAMAHAGADTEIPAKQGILGIFEVFFDTVVLCTMTAFVILIPFHENFPTGNGMALVISAFSAFYGHHAAAFVSTSVMLFAVCTVVSWGYYGKVALSYLLPSAQLSVWYCLLYAVCAVIFSFTPEKSAWFLSDLATALMTALNLTAVFLLRRKVLDETKAAGLCLPR